MQKMFGQSLGNDLQERQESTGRKRVSSRASVLIQGILEGDEGAMVLYIVGFFILFVPTGATLVSGNGNHSASPLTSHWQWGLSPLILSMVASDATLCADLSVLTAHLLLSTGSLIPTEGI